MFSNWYFHVDVIFSVGFKPLQSKAQDLKSAFASHRAKDAVAS